VHIGESGKHVCAWNSYLVKHKPSIILLLVSQLWTNIANFNAW
jgi:hypothetical protein